MFTCLLFTAVTFQTCLSIYARKLLLWVFCFARSVRSDVTYFSHYSLTTHLLMHMLPCIQLFRERLSEKVPAIMRNVLWVAFEFTVLQRNLKEWHERPWTYVCECYMIATEVGSTATLSWNSVLIISHIILSRVHFVRQPFSKELYKHSTKCREQTKTF